MPSRVKMAVWKVVAIAYGCAFAVDEPRVHAAGTFAAARRLLLTNLSQLKI